MLTTRFSTRWQQWLFSALPDPLRRVWVAVAVLCGQPVMYHISITLPPGGFVSVKRGIIAKNTVRWQGDGGHGL